MGVSAGGFAGEARHGFTRRLGSSWVDLADLLGVSPADRARFTQGYEASALWDGACPAGDAPAPATAPRGRMRFNALHRPSWQLAGASVLVVGLGLSVGVGLYGLSDTTSNANPSTIGDRPLSSPTASSSPVRPATTGLPGTPPPGSPPPGTAKPPSCPTLSSHSNLLENRMFDTPSGNAPTVFTPTQPGQPGGESVAKNWGVWANTVATTTTARVDSVCRPGGHALRICTYGKENGVVQRFVKSGVPGYPRVISLYSGHDAIDGACFVVDSAVAWTER